MAEIFPPRNLPNRAEQWGRAVEGEIIALEKSEIQVSQRENNWSRATAGRLSVMARNLREVVDRSSVSVQMGDLSVTGSQSSEPFPRLDTPVEFPKTSGNRYARVTLSGNVSSSASITARLYVYLIYQGNIIGAGQIQPYAPASTPDEWFNNAPALVMGTIVTLDEVPPEITVRIVRGADQFSTGTSTLTLEEPILTLTRSGKI